MTKTVLIVEDNELNMKLFHDLLDAHGYRTLQTRNGIEALALAREHRPHLILMDIQLPEVSGLEVTKWLKYLKGQVTSVQFLTTTVPDPKDPGKWRVQYEAYITYQQ